MDRRYCVVAVAALLTLVAGLSGCIGDDNGTAWGKPVKVVFTSLGPDTAAQVVYVNFTLGDKNDKYTKGSGTLRVAIWDHDGFEMLNKTYEIKEKDFMSFEILGLKATGYELKVPFADIAKSHDRGYSMIDGDRTMNGKTWFTYKGTTFEDTYDVGFLNPTIPEALLHPNEAPQADLMVNNPGFVGLEVVCNGSASFDPEGGNLDFEWDWGDGTSTTFFPSEVEEHVYDEPGTYTITMTVTDPEDATASRTIDVTMDWALAVTVNEWGIVAAGEYINQTYVEITITNQADVEVSVPVVEIYLKDDATGQVESNGTDVTIPSTLDANGDVTVVVYFDAPEGFAATKITVWGREFALS